jgi:hypothetical protein
MEHRFRVSCGRLLCSWMVQACSSFVIYGLQLLQLRYLNNLMLICLHEF